MGLELIRPHFHGRIMCLTRADTVGYVRLLMDAFPTIRFYERWHGGEFLEKNPTPPATRWLDAEGVARVNDSRFVLDPGWAPTWMREHGDSGKWKFTDPPPRPSGDLFGGRVPRSEPGGPPYIGETRVDIGRFPGNKEQAAIGRKLVRVVGKVAVNRYQAVSHPSYEPLNPSKKAASFGLATMPCVGHGNLRTGC